MKRLTEYDIEQLRAGAGHHQGHIAVPREVFDALLEGSFREFPAPRASAGFAFNLKLCVKKV